MNRKLALPVFSMLSMLSAVALLAGASLAVAQQTAPPAEPKADPHAHHQHEGQHEGHPAAPAPAPAPVEQTAAPTTPAHKYFGDVRLVDQNGREQRLYSDLLKGKTVVIDVMFTECTGVCPILSKKMEQVQTALGDRVGKDVYLLSISVDPTNDTPARLKEYAARYNAKPGWYFLTGSKQNVEEALRKLGQYVQEREAHQNLILIGNDQTGLWKKAMGLSDAEELIRIVKTVVDDQG